MFVCVHHEELQVPASLPTTIAAQFAWAPIKAWASTTAGVTEYVRSSGVASSIVDYGRDQSQLMTLRDGGLDRLFAIDWLPATDETADWSIEGYAAVLEEAVQFLGGRVNLVGDCQGGWLAVPTPA